MHSAEFYKALLAMRQLDTFHMTMCLHAALHWDEEKVAEELAAFEDRRPERVN
jgi:hypothetical protein